jgi:hypothetical protein
MTTEQRLEKLERQNRWMRRIGAVAVAVAAAVFLIGQGKDEDLPDLEVRSLTVKDEEGRGRVFLGSARDGSPLVQLVNKHSRPQVTLRMMLGSPLLVLSGKDGASAQLGIGPGNLLPFLSLRDNNRKPRAALGVHRAVGTEVTTADLTFRNPNGKVIWKAPKD